MNFEIFFLGSSRKSSLVLFENKNYSVPNGFHLKTFGDVTNSQLPGNSLAEKWLTTGSDYSEKKKQVVIV